MKSSKFINIILFIFLPLQLLYAQLTNFFPTEPTGRNNSRYKTTGMKDYTDSNLTYAGHFGWGPCFSTASKDNFVYAGNGSLIQILDMTNPSSPILVNEIDHVGLVEDMIVRDNLLFTLNPLQIFDVSDPANPERLYLSDNWGGYELLLDGNFLFIPNYIVIYIINISNPENPILEGEIYPPGFTTDVAKYNQYLYNTTGDALFVQIWDVSDLANPVEVGRIGNVSIKEDLKIDGNYLYIAPIEIWDLSQNPASPELISTYCYPIFPDDVFEIEVADTLMFATMKNNGLSVINIKNKTNPYEMQRLGWIGYPTASLGPWQIDVQNEILYTAAHTGLWTIKRNTNDSLSTVSFYNTGSTASDILVDGTYGYGAFNRAGLIIININNPIQPRFVSQFTTQGAALKIAKKNNLIFLLTRTDLLLIDVTDIVHPIELARIPGSYLYSMAITDSTVICGSDSNNIRIINYSDPFHPFIQKQFEVSKFPGDLAVYKNYLYSAEEYYGLNIYDISLPIPIKVNEITDEDGLGVLVRNNVLYVAMGGELRIYNLDYPAAPNLVSNISTPGSRSYRVNLDIDKNDSTYIYMFYGYNMEILNVADLSHPFIAAYLRGDEAAVNGMDISGKYIFAAQGINGLNVYTNDLLASLKPNSEFEQPNIFQLYQNFPNPFNSSTTISYYLPEPDFINIKIADILGREIIKLAADTFNNAGTHFIHFDSKNLSSGVYFISVETTRQVKNIKIVILK